MNETPLRGFVATFVNTYDAPGKDAIWRRQSAVFQSFWSDKVLARRAATISDDECDVVIRILDRHGKGNTKETEVVARTMVTQEKWRKLFNSLHTDRNLALLVDSIFKENNLEEKAKLIDRLCETNKGKKNYLTGETGTTINALLAAYDPVKNLSSVSLNHRKMQLDFLELKLPFDWDKTLLGQRIVQSNRLLCEATRDLGIAGSARTLGGFWYSKPIKELWEKKPNKAKENLLKNFIVGKIYSRQDDIYKPLGGRQESGAFIPADLPAIFLFTGQGRKGFDYHDGWDENGNFRLFGEGQEGDMQFVRGNKAIRDHLVKGRDLYLFESLGKSGAMRFLGVFQCAGHGEEQAPDKNGVQRKVIVFFLAPIGDAKNEFKEIDTTPKSENMAELRTKAYAASNIPGKTTSKESTRNLRIRSEAVRQYVLVRAKGNCECCKEPAPFTRTNGTPYLEPHHTHRLADDGPDNPAWVAAICPNCHREVHYGLHGVKLNQKLQHYVETLEKEVITSRPDKGRHEPAPLNAIV